MPGECPALKNAHSERFSSNGNCRIIDHSAMIFIPGRPAQGRRLWHLGEFGADLGLGVRPDFASAIFSSCLSAVSEARRCQREDWVLLMPRSGEFGRKLGSNARPSFAVSGMSLFPFRHFCQQLASPDLRAKPNVGGMIDQVGILRLPGVGVANAQPLWRISRPEPSPSLTSSP
jgi:hypothetical protein